MAIEVGLAGFGDPREILDEWYPYQLASVYAYVTNKTYKDGYNRLSKEEQNKYPEVVVERDLEPDELIIYKKQLKKEISLRMSKLTSKKK